jgi:hypothetical protein
MISFIYKWWHFFFPVKGWKPRYLAFTRGQKSWPVPGRPDAPHVMPFPVEWIPHRIVLAVSGVGIAPRQGEEKKQDDSAEQEAVLQGPQRSTEEKDETPSPHRMGFEFLSSTCSDTGKPLPIGVGVLCCRCGVPLHPEAASMFGGFDPPICRRCKPIVRLVG